MFVIASQRLQLDSCFGVNAVWSKNCNINNIEGDHLWSCFNESDQPRKVDQFEGSKVVCTPSDGCLWKFPLCRKSNAFHCQSQHKVFTRFFSFFNKSVLFTRFCWPLQIAKPLRNRSFSVLSSLTSQNTGNLALWAATEPSWVEYTSARRLT